ncbi:Zinc finger CCCH domain-containing protein 25 [Bienertia sinuspersici]
MLSGALFSLSSNQKHCNCCEICRKHIFVLQRKMTIDDEKSIYVGGIPYDCTESQLRRSFDLYGSVVAVKIINDRGVGGKCYGFVTFKNPRSAMEAISEMDGRTIGGRVVRVNEVKTRGGGGNSSHGREGLRHNQREMAWNKGRSRDRESDYDKDRRRDHSREHDGGRGRRRSHSRDRFQGRDQEQSKDMGEWELRRAHSRNHDRERERDNDLDAIRDRFQGRDREQSRDMGDWELGRAHSRNHDPERERDDDLDAIKDSEFDRVDDRDRRVDKRNDQHTKRLNSSINCDQRSREFSSESSDYQYQVEEQLDMSIKRREELQKEKSDMEQG